MTSEILAVIIGGLIGAGASILSSLLLFKHEKQMAASERKEEQKKWCRDRAVLSYIKIASLLDEINVFIDGNTGNANAEEYNIKLAQFAEMLDIYKGEISLFFTNPLKNELIKLKAELFQIANEEKAQQINLENIMDSQAMRVSKHAMQITTAMRKEIGAD